MSDPRLAVIAHDGTRIDVETELVSMAWCPACRRSVNDPEGEELVETISRAWWHAESVHGPEASRKDI